MRIRIEADVDPIRMGSEKQCLDLMILAALVHAVHEQFGVGHFLFCLINYIYEII